MTPKIFLTKSGKAGISCPECGKTKLMDIERFSHRDKEIRLKITCKCNHIFSVFLERRKYVRRGVNLPGVLIASKKKYSIFIIEVSRLGLKIRTEKVLDLNPDDKVVIEFILDDAGRSRISKKVVIRKIDQQYINVEFLSQQHYDRFGVYILFHFDYSIA
jgi:hypothetical protein